MFSSLLVLLAPMGFENCTLKRSKPLFFDPRLSINPKVRIVEGNWDEARLVPHVAGILIHEMFGLTVEYVRDGVNGTGSNSSRMYDMLKNDEADLALTLWPAKFLTTDRLAALSRPCEKSLSERCVATVGNQGYKGRSGWFVTARVSAVRGKEAEWSTVVSLYDRNHTENLMKADEIQTVTDLCKSFPDAFTYGGWFDCADGSWMHEDSACCSRLDYRNGFCGAKKPCVALIVDNPSYDEGLNEGIAGRLAQAIRVSNQDGQAVGIQIVYGNVSAEVKEAEARNRPLLIYSWLPRPEIMTPNRFVRITLESFYHCGEGDAERDANFLAEPSVLAEPLLRGVPACDFPVEQVEKAAVWRLRQPSATNAKLFVGKFSLNSTQLKELLELGDELSFLQSSNSSDVSLEWLDEVACRWLNSNTEAWEAWLPSSNLYDTPLFQWGVWVIVCSACFIVVLGCVIWKAKKMEKETAVKAGVENQDKPMDKEEVKRLAKELASDCYVSAIKAFWKLIGVYFAIGYLFYYTFKKGIPRVLSLPAMGFLLIGPGWLSIGLFGLLYRSRAQPSGVPTSLHPFVSFHPLFVSFLALTLFYEDANGTAAKVKSYKRAYAGLMWSATCVLWAVAPIFMTPLISDVDPDGTRSAPLSDVLTLLAALKSTGDLLIATEECFTKVLRCSDKAVRVLDCLNKHTPMEEAEAEAALSASASASALGATKGLELHIGRMQRDQPLKRYLIKASEYLLEFIESGSDNASAQMATRYGLFFFGIGQLFVAASSGFFKILLFETWIGDGLNKLSLEVTISCAVLMLTLVLIDWSVELLPSGEDIVRCGFEKDLLRKLQYTIPTPTRANPGEGSSNQAKNKEAEGQPTKEAAASAVQEAMPEELPTPGADQAIEAAQARGSKAEAEASRLMTEAKTSKEKAEELEDTKTAALQQELEDAKTAAAASKEELEDFKAADPCRIQ